MGDECYSTDRINAVCEQLTGFILNEILDPRGEFTTTVTSIEDFHRHPEGTKDFHRHPEGTSSWTANMTCTFVNIFKHYALMFVNL